MNSDVILNQFFSDYVHAEKLKFRNVKLVRKLIKQVIKDGPANLQDIIRLSPLMSAEFKARSRERFDKLLPVELDTTLTIEQKIPTVIASFQEGFGDIVNSEVVTKKILAQIITDAIRDNIETVLKCLHEAKIPLLIFSAGFGDLVEGLLHKLDIYYPNINVIANFMEFDDNERLVGFKPPLIHTFNKNDSVIPKNCQHMLAHRTNVILLGDSIGDITMAESMKRCGSLLKIGFLNEVNVEQLNIFLDSFDIVLLDDHTIDFVNFLLKKIIVNADEL